MTSMELPGRQITIASWAQKRRVQIEAAALRREEERLGRLLDASLQGAEKFATAGDAAELQQLRRSPSEGLVEGAAGSPKAFRHQALSATVGSLSSSELPLSPMSSSSSPVNSEAPGAAPNRRMSGARRTLEGAPKVATMSSEGLEHSYPRIASAAPPPMVASARLLPMARALAEGNSQMAAMLAQGPPQPPRPAAITGRLTPKRKVSSAGIAKSLSGDVEQALPQRRVSSTAVITVVDASGGTSGPFSPRGRVPAEGPPRMCVVGSQEQPLQPHLVRRHSVAHTTADSVRREHSPAHTTADNLHREHSAAHTTADNLQREPSAAHTTADSMQREHSAAHTTAGIVRRRHSAAHTTADSVRREHSPAHTTADNLHREHSAAHTTADNLQREPSAAHTTADSMQREHSAAHTTAGIVRRRHSAAHTTAGNVRREHSAARPAADSLRRDLSPAHHPAAADSSRREPPVLDSAATKGAVEDAFVTDASSSSAAASPSSGEQVGGQSPGEATASLVKLLELWKAHRHSDQALSLDERQSIEGVLFETMPPDRVKVVTVSRVEQPDLLRKFCEEEEESLARERNHQKKHKEFMLLHGTRWENAESICANGLDPECGHLGRGSWLGQNAEAAHSYAAKGPGPEQEDGLRLFTLFGVACLPNQIAGDGERSFGVWRMMSRTRMYPAYQVVYMAPMDIRGRRPVVSPRMNRSVEVLLQRRQSLSSIESSSRLGGMCSDDLSASSPRSLRSPRASCSDRRARSSDTKTRESDASPSSPSGLAQTATDILSQSAGDLTSSLRSNKAAPRSQGASVTLGKDLGIDGFTPRRRLSEGAKPAASGMHHTKSASSILSPRLSQSNESAQSPGQPRSSGSLSLPVSSPGQPTIMNSPSSKNVSTPNSQATSSAVPSPCPAKSTASLSPGQPKQNSGQQKLASSTPSGQKNSIHAPSTSSFGQLRTASNCASSWEVQLDDGWAPFRPGSRYNDHPGTKQHMIYGQFWYRLVFDTNGTTGTQTNLSTGKTRLLRRVGGVDTSEQSHPSESSRSRPAASSTPADSRGKAKASPRASPPVSEAESHAQGQASWPDSYTLQVLQSKMWHTGNPQEYDVDAPQNIFVEAAPTCEDEARSTTAPADSPGASSPKAASPVQSVTSVGEVTFCPKRYLAKWFPNLAQSVRPGPQ
eukprot:TRINITY_DN5175_c0_g1_i1.p1 TRINITY_DN5175_c0_g1~~TRINITY_DN5175_c0_g1_i1.p1  ORF type:complete len:1170 (-),score=153.04 TRINITY_DN5175_c0_g1_i1:88-3597(-)